MRKTPLFQKIQKYTFAIGLLVTTNIHAVTVTDNTSLYSAIFGASGGDVIELEPGNYGMLWVSNITPSSEVIIRSKNPNQKATIERIQFTNYSNITFQDIIFDVPVDTSTVVSNLVAHIGNAIFMNNGSNVKIDRCEFIGGQVQGNGRTYGSGRGISIRNSNNVEIANSVFHDLYNGLLVKNTTNTIIRDNEMHTLSLDGIDLTEVDNAVVERNYLHNFDAYLGFGGHPDMIQLWSFNTTVPSKNVTLRDNILFNGAYSTQGIHMRNEAVELQSAGANMWYNNFVIENNLIYNGSLHGIDVTRIHGLTIRNNTLIRNNYGLGSFDTPVIMIDLLATNVVIENNATHWSNWVVSGLSITGSNVNGAGEFQMQNNCYIQNIQPFADDYYDALFVNATVQDATLADLAPIEGGKLEQNGIGSDIYYGSNILPQASGSTVSPTGAANSISGRFFYDNDEDNQESIGDTNVINATVNLYTVNNSFLASTQTDNLGNYTLSGMLPGYYKVQFIKPTGTTFVVGNQGGAANDTYDSDVWNYLDGFSSSVNLTLGGNITDVDAGITGGTPPPVPPNSNFLMRDFDGDGKNDLLWRNSSNSRTVIHFMDDTIKTSNSYTTQTISFLWNVAGYGDFDGDGKADILWRNSSNSRTVIHFMDGATFLNAQDTDYAVGNSWSVEGVEDFNNDGKADILWRNISNGEMRLHYMNGATFQSAERTSQTVGLKWEIAGVSDFDGDGNVDIAWRKLGSSRVAIQFMDGATMISAGDTDHPVGQNWKLEGAQDMDGDGKGDLHWRNLNTGALVIQHLDGLNSIDLIYTDTVVSYDWNLIVK